LGSVSIDFGDVPTWVAAIGTVGAFAVTYGLLRDASQRRTAELDAKLMEQARLVWAEVVVVGPHGPGRAIITTRIINGSAEPVDVVKIEVWSGTSPAAQPTYFDVAGLVGPGSYSPPGISAAIDAPPDVLPEPAAIPLTLRFRDAAGYRWQRGPGLGLERVPNDVIEAE
jgi:hypothetical protein